MRNLQGKAILVCGGATGIGAATARRLCEEGATCGHWRFQYRHG